MGPILFGDEFSKVFWHEREFGGLNFFELGFGDGEFIALGVHCDPKGAFFAEGEAGGAVDTPEKASPDGEECGGEGGGDWAGTGEGAPTAVANGGEDHGGGADGEEEEEGNPELWPEMKKPLL